MGSEHEQEYDAAFVELLESVWGEGFLSPGGPEEVTRILEGLELRGARVLDIGCGTGGAVFVMADRHAAGHVVGVDVGASLIEEARRVLGAGIFRVFATFFSRSHVVRTGPGAFWYTYITYRQMKRSFTNV